MLPQLLGQGGERPAAAERVAGEVGELQQQLARPVGVGPHERGDRGQRVVDEVRADLGPQRAQLGLHRPGALPPEVGQLDLGGHPPGDLLGGPGQARRGGRPVGAERGDDAVVGDDRGQHRGADRAVGVVAGHLGGVQHHRAAGREDLAGVPPDVRPVVGALAVPGQRGRRCRTARSPACPAARAGGGSRGRRRRGSARRAGGARPARWCAGCRTSPGRPATRGRGVDAGRGPVRGAGRRRPAS